MIALASTLDKIFTIFLISLSFLVAALFVILYFLHRNHYHLIYHRHNKIIERFERKYGINLVDKKIRFKNSQKTYMPALRKNLAAIDSLNCSIDKLLQLKKSHRNISREEIIKSLTGLPNIPLLNDICEFQDSSKRLLLADIISFFKKRNGSCLSDKFIIRLFGSKNYLKTNNKYVYIYNECYLLIEINKKLMTSTLLDYKNLNMEIVKSSDYLFKNKFNLILQYKNKSLLSLYKHSRKSEIDVYDQLMLIAQNFEIYHECETIKDAFTKMQHLKKVCQNTIAKINTMSGIKFINWIKSALSSIYEVDVLLKSDKDLGYYLSMDDNEKTGRVVVQVKRHSERISSVKVKEIKQVQSLEGATEAWLITNNSYTKQAIELASATKVKLIDKVGLDAIVERYSHNYYKTI